MNYHKSILATNISIFKKKKSS